MSDKDKSTYFQDLVNKSKEEPKADPYALEQYGEAKKSSRLTAKINRIKNTFFGKEGFSEKFLQGLKMGATVGGIFGTLAGTVAFYQTRNIIYIPLSAITMGLSFGFFMGVGTLVRSDDELIDTNSYELVQVDNKWELRTLEADWKRKYRI